MKSKNAFAILGLVLVVGCVPSEKRSSDGAPSPSAAADKKSTPSSVHTDARNPSWVAVPKGSGGLAAAIAREIAKKPSATAKPIVYLGASWCDPCAAIKRFKTDPRMLDAFQGTYVIELDVDDWKSEGLGALGYKTGTVPVFYAVDAAGKASGPTINGGAWGDNIPETMAPPLKKFVLSIPS